MSERQPVAEADEDTEADGRTDADPVAHRCTVGDRVVIGSDGDAVPDTAADSITDAVAGACVTEPWTRDARLDRIGGDDRRVRVDLASLPQLS